MVYFLFFVFLIVFMFLSGILAGSETAITGASRAQMHQLSKKGNIRAQQVRDVQEHLESSISTILVSANFVNYVVPSITAWFSSQYLDATSTAILTISVAVTMSIYAEIFPKMLAINDICKFAMFIVPFVSYLIRILKPFVSILEAIARGSLRMIGVNVGANSHMVHSEEELRGAIALHGENGEKKFMLNGILDLEDTTVNSVMTHRKNLVTLNIDTPPSKMISEVLKIPYSRIPIWKDSPENIIGILRTRTLLSEFQKITSEDVDKINIRQLISDPWFIPETTYLLDQLQEFRKRCEHFAIVVDEYGDLMGIITLEDILEEIVGEIVDEYDTAQCAISAQPDGSIIVDGKISVRDLNRQFNWSLPEEDATTVAGLVIHEVRKIPEIGEIYVLYGFKIEIMRRQRNQISLLKITKL